MGPPTCVEYAYTDAAHVRRFARFLLANESRSGEVSLRSLAASYGTGIDFSGYGVTYVVLGTRGYGSVSWH